MSIDWVAFIADAIRMATPLVFAALAALITRRRACSTRALKV